MYSLFHHFNTGLVCFQAIATVQFLIGGCYLPCDLFLNGFGICLREEGEEGAAEVVSVAVGVAQLVCYGVQEEIAP